MIIRWHPVSRFFIYLQAVAFTNGDDGYIKDVIFHAVHQTVACRASIAIMPFALVNFTGFPSIPRQAVYEPMHAINAPAPISAQIPFQGLRLPNACMPVTRNIFHESIDAL